MILKTNLRSSSQAIRQLRFPNVASSSKIVFTNWGVAKWHKAVLFCKRPRGKSFYLTDKKAANPSGKTKALVLSICFPFVFLKNMDSLKTLKNNPSFTFMSLFVMFDRHKAVHCQEWKDENRFLMKFNRLGHTVVTARVVQNLYGTERFGTLTLDDQWCNCEIE